MLRHRLLSKQPGMQTGCVRLSIVLLLDTGMADMKLQPTPSEHSLCLQVTRLEAITETAARVHSGAAPMPAQTGAGAVQPALGPSEAPASAAPGDRQAGEDDLEETLPLLARRVLAGRQSVAPGQGQMGAAVPKRQASSVCPLAAQSLGGIRCLQLRGASCC